MSRLSFAQILQKKKSENTMKHNSSHNSYVNTSKLLKSQLTANETQYPSLTQLMDQFIQYPNDPEQNFILSFDASNRQQSQSDYGRGSQDFEGGINPLDSFIMSQSYINANKPKGTKFFASNKNQVGKISRQLNMNQLCKHYINTKQNKSFNQANTDNLYKFSSKNYRESMQNSQQQFKDDSNKYYQANTAGYLKQPNNKQMIVNTKIIQSQSYQNGAICESKRENIGKIQRSEKIGPKTVQKLDIEQNRKIQRYQVNYQQSQRKQVAEPPKQKKRLIISKMLQQKNNPSKISSQSSNNMHLIKNQEQQQQLLIPDIPTAQNIQKIPQIHKKTQVPQVNPVSTLETELNEQQKRIQDAKKQINQYLLIRQKSSKQEKTITVTKTAFYKQQTSKIIDVIKNSTNQQININNQYSQNVTNYSFAHNKIQQNKNSPSTNHVKICDSFQETKKKLKQIEEQKRAKQNERFLFCIEYTQSEVDVDDQDEGKIDMAGYKRNSQVSQSIPERKQRKESQPFTLQKYMPNKQQRIQPIKPQQSKPYLPNDRTQNYLQQYSQMIQKVQVQPSTSSIQQESQNTVNNSQHPCLQYQLSSQSQRQVQVKQPYHDVSSIDIRASGSIGEQFIMPYGEKQIRMQIDDSTSRQNKEQNDNGAKEMQIPNLNITDFQSASNMSCPSPLKTPSNNQNQSQSQVQSHQPVSSNQSIKLHVQQNQNNYGFIYKMRVHSRNNSFTSNYDSRVHGQVGRQGDWKDGCGSNHNSMYIKQESKKQDNQDKINVQQYNMSKYKNNNKKYDEVGASVNIKDFYNISSSNNKPHESIQLPVINLQQYANLSSCQLQLMMANNYPQQLSLNSYSQNIHQENIQQQPTVYQKKQTIIYKQQVYIPPLNRIVNLSISSPDKIQEIKEKQIRYDVKLQQKQQIKQQQIIKSQTTVQKQQQLINIKQQAHTIDRQQIQQKSYFNIPADIKQSTNQILINIESQIKPITQNIQIVNKIQINTQPNNHSNTFHTLQQIYDKQVHGKFDKKQDKISSSLSISTIIQPQIPRNIILQTVTQQTAIFPQTKLSQPKFVINYNIPQKITQNPSITTKKIPQPKLSTYIQAKSSLKSSIKGILIMPNKSIKNDKDQQSFEFDLDF